MVQERLSYIQNTGSNSVENNGKGFLKVEDLNAWYGNTLAVKEMNMDISSQIITAIIGPSGCGKSTYIRCLNRLHEVSPGGRVSEQDRSMPCPMPRK